MINKLKRAFTQPTYLLAGLLNRTARLWPDKAFLKLKFWLTMKKRLDLKDPKTFNEKLQWLKLYDKKNEYTVMVDKIEVKEYVASIIGDKYIIPTLGVYHTYDEIDFEKLPNQFVLKCSHDSGGVVICKDKSSFDKRKAKEILEQGLKQNFFYQNREWPYKNVIPRLLAEQYITDVGSEIYDYKVHNFNGVPKFILVCKNRFKGGKVINDFYTDKWEFMDIRRPGNPNSPTPQTPPVELEKLLELSKMLSKNIPFLRTDFYIANGKIYFGELTFYPASGMVRFEPEHWDNIFGDWIKIGEIN